MIGSLSWLKPMNDMIAALKRENKELMKQLVELKRQKQALLDAGDKREGEDG